jgi:hypothetical protein
MLRVSDAGQRKQRRGMDQKNHGRGAILELLDLLG